MALRLVAPLTLQAPVPPLVLGLRVRFGSVVHLRSQPSLRLAMLCKLPALVYRIRGRLIRLVRQWIRLSRLAGDRVRLIRLAGQRICLSRLAGDRVRLMRLLAWQRTHARLVARDRNRASRLARQRTHASRLASQRNRLSRPGAALTDGPVVVPAPKCLPSDLANFWAE